MEIVIWLGAPPSRVFARALALVVLLCLPAAQADWLQRGYDAGRTGDAQQPGPEWGDVSYVRQAHGFQGLFAVVNGVAYFRALGEAGTPPFAVWGLDLRTGVMKPLISETPPFAQGLSDGHRLFVLGDAHVAAYDLPSGAFVWTRDVGAMAPYQEGNRDSRDSTTCGPPIISEGILYVECVYQPVLAPAPPLEARTASVTTVHAIEVATGRLVWNWTAGRDAADIPGQIMGGVSMPASGSSVDPIGVTVVGEWVLAVTATNVPRPVEAGGPGWYWDGWVLGRATGQPPSAAESPFPPFPGATAPRFGHHPSAGGAAYEPSPHQPSLMVGNERVVAFKNDPYPGQTNPASGTDRLLSLQHAKELIRIGDVPVADGSEPPDKGMGLAIAGRAIYAASGRHIWRVDEALNIAWQMELPTGHYVPAGDAVVAGDRLYIKSADAAEHATLEVRDVLDGHVVWSQLFASCCPAVVATEDLLVTVDFQQIAIMGRTPLSLQPDVAVSTSSPRLGATVDVDLSKTRAGESGAATAFRADWGDGDASEWGPSPVLSHVYAGPGVMHARFFVRNKDQQTASAPMVFRVVPESVGWLAAPLSAENLPLTLLGVGLVVVGAAGGGGTLVLRRRVARQVSRLEEVAPPSASVVVPGAMVLGKYLVERELGAGGGGRAFLAQDIRMERRVVLKTIVGADPGAALREARASGGIEHPNVVRVYDIEAVAEGAMLVLEYIDGGTLKERIAASGPLSETAFARLVRDLLSALHTVHQSGAVHSDIKPSNVLLTRAGEAKVADFGIARQVGLEQTMGQAPSGSVPYMSPEQARGERVTAASDLYSAAVTFYEARTGQPLVAAKPGESAMAMQMRIAAGTAVTLDMGPPALRACFVRALSPTPGLRFASASAMAKAFAEALG